ncbi:hypothetical protein [Occallatibacter riparius]|uniref:Uncharacterized protein n=1 Tax=Occallatibacter riparius TaxID=1002689 RepID=A0A9J7BKU1_9BACT|nr:hypothetical protein [Occallatibacter riparius]UWZ83057.1 hypothetical protein MOP44_21110 [Occallatibacter riparius]
MRKPEGHLRTAAETCFCLLVFCLPYWHSLLMAGITGSLSFLCLTILLAFVVGQAPQATAAFAACLRALPFSWMAPAPSVQRTWPVVPLALPLSGPALVPSFQRPPPLFS